MRISLQTPSYFIISIWCTYPHKHPRANLYKHPLHPRPVVWGWGKCSSPYKLVAISYINEAEWSICSNFEDDFNFFAWYMRKEANMNIYLDQQQSVLSKTAKARAFTSKEQICPSADWREWAKCRGREILKSFIFLAYFNIFQISSWKKVLASHWALNMNPKNKLPLFPTRLLWGSSLEAFVGWNWGLKRGRSWNLRAVQV